MSEFDTRTNEAFEQLGALPPGQHWSQFDVSLKEAHKGAARVLVTTLWNFHWSEVDGKRQAREPAISRDPSDGSLWYRVSRSKTSTSTNASHWARIALARKLGVPIVGVLKDFATSRCSMSDTFQCKDVRDDLSDDSRWLQLQPIRPLAINLGTVNIHARTGLPAAQLTLEPILPRMTLLELKQEFTASVERSSRDTSEARRERLRRAQKNPDRIPVASYEFARNPDVVAEVLYLAKGICGQCVSMAPFARRSDGSPYLEVHHKVPLAAGGEDTVENAVALCPNCHRELHYGASAAIDVRC